MIDRLDIAGSELSAEEYHVVLVDQWKCLTDIRQSLESANEQSMTADFTSSAIAHIAKITRELSLMPDHLVLLYLVSKDALLHHLQTASIELNLLSEELTKKRRTGRYFKSLLACKNHLDRALEQKRDTLCEWQGMSWQNIKLLPAHKHSRNRPAYALLNEGRQYQADLQAAWEALHYIDRLFKQELEIWPDQCRYASSLLENVQALMLELCSLLDALAGFRAALSPHYCRLLVLLHHLYDKVHRTDELIAHYRMICRSSSQRSVSTKKNIIFSLDYLVKNIDDALPLLTMFLDQASFQERRTGQQSDQAI